MTDRRAAEIMYPNQGGDWKIVLMNHPIAHRGHAYFALVRGEKEVVSELHGFGHSKNTEKKQDLATDGGDLKGEETIAGFKSEPIGTLMMGNREEIERIWAKGAAAIGAINEKKFDYKPSDVSFELGTDGGQIQNSNSVAYTLSKAMGVDAGRLLQEKGKTRRFPGWGRDLLDPNYERYVAPPVFPVRDAP